jgi:hypothetical protein
MSSKPATVPAPTLAPSKSVLSSLNLKSVLLYGALFGAFALLITNIVLVTNLTGSADSWNEIKKQLSSIVATAVTCGVLLTIALYLVVVQYPEMQMPIMAITLGIALTLSYAAVCIATITR